MKRLVQYLTILVAAAITLSCYWTANLGTSGFQLDFSNVQSKAAGDLVRVYLLADGNLLSVGDTVPYVEEDLDSGGQKITIENLPVGPQYQALVGVGNTAGSIFQVSYYGESKTFELSTGDEITVSVTLQSMLYSVTYSTDLAGKELKGVVATETSYIYTADLSKIYALDPGTLALETTEPYHDLGAEGFSVNSLSESSVSAWQGFINTDKGILPFNYSGVVWDFDSDFSTALGGEKNLQESGVFDTGAASPIYNFFFRRKNGLGGVTVPNAELGSPETWEWVNLELDGVLDMACSDWYAYYATSGGAFALPPNILADTTPSIAEHRLSFSAPAKILSVAINTETDYIYLGTANGAWEGLVTEDDPAGVPNVSVGVLTQIPETAGYGITQITVSSDSGYAAYLSRYYLFIRKGVLVTRFPFFAVIPGKASGLDLGNINDWTLYIAGSEGLSSLYIGC